jgi:glycosyltransferase involved in cell wall biosynthesis
MITPVSELPSELPSDTSLLVSVIVPVYNGAKFFRQAMHNLQSQGYDAMEVIVIDDGSVDETAQIAAEFSAFIRYVYQDNRGPSAARNHGLSLAQGDIIAFLDIDDLWPDHKLVRQLQPFYENPSLDVVWGQIQQMRAIPRADTLPEADALHPGDADMQFVPFSQPYVCFNLGSALFRRSAFEQIGSFDEAQIHSEDVDWLMRAKEAHLKLQVLQEVTLLYRKHDANMTHDKGEGMHHFLRALKKSIDRRREKSGGEAEALPDLVEMS